MVSAEGDMGQAGDSSPPAQPHWWLQPQVAWMQVIGRDEQKGFLLSLLLNSAWDFPVTAISEKC